MDRLAIALLSLALAQDREITPEETMARERMRMHPLEASMLPPINAAILATLNLPDPPKQVERPSSVSLASLSHKVPKKARQAFERAQKHQKANRPEESARELEQAVKIDPEYAAAHNDLGVVYFLLGRLPAAKAEIRLAAQLDPALASAHANLANIAVGERDWDTAQAEAQRLLAVGGQREEALRILEIVAARKR